MRELLLAAMNKINENNRRHHYLPQFYIQGFVNSGNKISVYDKAEKEFKKNEFSPKQIFFEWNRNTLLIQGEKDDFIEKLYGRFESMISSAYIEIVSSLREALLITDNRFAAA